MQSARAIDASMAAADDEVLPDDDPSVSSVPATGGAGRAGAHPRSASPTPPPKSPPRKTTLADDLAILAANGQQIPGMHDDDTLLQGNSGSDAENGAEAVRQAKAAIAKEKSKHKPKKDKAVPVSGSESDEIERRAPSKKKQRRTDCDAGKRRKSSAVAEKVIDVDEDEKSSRHVAVTNSQIYKDWSGAVLDETRREFQSLIIARDGIFIKKHSGHRILNFNLVLLAAHKAMTSKDYRSFKDQMDRAMKDTNRE